MVAMALASKREVKLYGSDIEQTEQNRYNRKKRIHIIEGGAYAVHPDSVI